MIELGSQPTVIQARDTVPLECFVQVRGSVVANRGATTEIYHCNVAVGEIANDVVLP